MTVGSLFAGIGGFDLGFTRAGYDIAWQVEIDPFCRAVLAKHWPDVKRVNDVRECGAHNLERVDVVCAGVPCQPVSHNGHQRVQDDPRWLWPHVARLIRELRPDYLVLENVSGLLARGLSEILGDLAALGCDAEWEVLPAYAFGAAQRRDRVFLVAYSDRIRREAGEGVFPARVGSRLPASSLRGIPRRSAGGRIRCEPDGGVHGMADGLPGELDRLKALGNAIVPQIAEWIAHQIKAHAEGRVAA